MLKALPLHVAAGVCAMVVATAAPLYAQADLKRWYFAEGSTNAQFGFEQEILIANPTAQKAPVTLRFLPQDGSAPEVHKVEVLAHSRQGFYARQFVDNAYGVALEVTSEVDVVVERSMYWGGGLFNFPGLGAVTDLRAGHNVMGVNAPALSWSFAEGAAGGPLNFNTYVLVSNPSMTDSASVKVTYFTSQGERVLDLDSGLLGPGQRRTYFANVSLDATLNSRPQYDFAIEVTSENSVPVVAERAMYWGPNFQGGHAATGVQPDSVWYFSEGVQGLPPVNFDTFVLLYNPSDSEAIDVEVDFFGKSGLAATRTVRLNPRTRANVWTAQVPELAGDNNPFSVRAINVLGKPFVAERAVYWKNMREGTASAGTPKAARKWGFADGQEGGFAQFQNPADPDPRHFSTYYLVLNNTPNPVTVRGVFYIEGQSGVGQQTTLQVPAFSRGTIAPAALPGLHNQKFAAFFEASAEVIVERALYWGAGFVGGHASAGAALPDSLPTLPAPAAPGAPALTSITPARGAPGGGTSVIITGNGFGLSDSPAGQTTVHFGAAQAAPHNVTVLNANQIRVVTPPSAKGVANVVVSTRGATVELPGAFEYFDPFAATGAPRGSMSSRYADVSAVAAANPFYLITSCSNHNFMYEVVAELRRRDGTNRWGLNWKRGNVGDLSHDIVNYYYGPEGGDMRNSSQVWIFDIIGGHCGSNPNPFWIDQTGPTRQAGTIGRWTTEPLCSRYRDVMHNGAYLFPECRP